MAGWWPRQRAWTRWFRPVPVALARPLTFLAVVVGWVFFRAPSVQKALSMLASMAGFPPAGADTSPQGPSVSTQWVVLAALLLFVNIAPTTKQWVESRELNVWRAVGLGTLFFLALILMRTSVLTNTPSPFIYFQF